MNQAHSIFWEMNLLDESLKRSNYSLLKVRGWKKRFPVASINDRLFEKPLYARRYLNYKNYQLLRRTICGQGIFMHVFLCLQLLDWWEAIFNPYPQFFLYKLNALYMYIQSNIIASLSHYLNQLHYLWLHIL